MSPAANPPSAGLKWACLFLGLLLLVGSLAGMGFTGMNAWTLWQRAHLPVKAPVPAVPAKPGAPPAAKTPAPAAPHVTMDDVTPVAGWFLGEVIGVFLGVWLLQMPGKKEAAAKAAAAAQESGLVLAVAHPAKARRVANKRWQSCNVLEIGPGVRKLWTFGAGKGGFNLSQEQTIPPGRPLPAGLVGRDWKVLFQPKLNIAWLPVEQVFLRVAQLPAGDFDETLSMVELQLEKLSPLPVTQIVWSIQILPQQADNLQTVVVIIMARDLVEKFLGELEGQGFLADRLELPILDQLQATNIRHDGAYIYPDVGTGKLTALVAWWYGGVLRSLGLLHVPAVENRSEVLQEQLSQMAWAGELEGWLQAAPRWHLLADETAAAEWQPMFQTWLGRPVETIPPLSEAQLAGVNANRSARSDPKAGMLPIEYSTRYAQQFYDRLWMRGLMAVLCVYIGAAAIYLAAATVQGMRTENVEAEVAGASRSYTNTLQLKAQVEILQNRQALKFASLACWKATAELLPEGVTVGTLEFRDGKHFSLSGSAPADQSSQITDFNESMRKYTLNGQPLFEQLSIPQVKLNPGNTTLSWSFAGDLARAEETK